jgi:hypothetical protein
VVDGRGFFLVWNWGTCSPYVDNYAGYDYDNTTTADTMDAFLEQIFGSVTSSIQISLSFFFVSVSLIIANRFFLLFR